MLLLLIILALSNSAWHFHQPLYQKKKKKTLQITITSEQFVLPESPTKKQIF